MRSFIDNHRGTARAVCAMLAAGVIATTSSCSFLADSQQTISVNSDPTGAEVTFNGQYIGQTPTSASVNRKDKQIIVLKKEGYRTTQRNTSRGLSTVGIVDVVGTFFILLPILGLLSGGAWEQNPDTLFLRLDEETDGNTSTSRTPAPTARERTTDNRRADRSKVIGVWSGYYDDDANAAYLDVSTNSRGDLVAIMYVRADGEADWARLEGDATYDGTEIDIDFHTASGKTALTADLSSAKLASEGSALVGWGYDRGNKEHGFVSLNSSNLDSKMVKRIVKDQ